jgi:sugar transferase (PEP-CTERM/EpsH1 system associated)
MKILFLCHRFPYPPERGGKIRPFNMIRWLGARHEVTVASVARSAEELGCGKDLQKYCHRVIPGLISPYRAWLQAVLCLFTSRPSSLGYFYVPKLKEAVKNLVSEEEFDLIMVHCSSVAQYVPDSLGCRCIMDFGDMDSEKWFQYARRRTFPFSIVYTVEGIKLRRYEKALACRYGECVVISPGERKILDAYGLDVPVSVVPNGVDLDQFTDRENEYDPLSIVFVGRMDYFPNIDAVEYFCRHILPLIRRDLPEASFTIVGSDPVRSVRNLARLPGVSVTGYVPDVKPFLRRAAVSVAPLRIACGIQNKVLEAMAMQVPVVATTSAFEGIDAVAQEHLLVSDTPEEFSAQVLALMKDPQLCRRLSLAGRKRIEDCHTWPACLQRLDRIVTGSATEVSVPLG